MPKTTQPVEFKPFVDQLIQALGEGWTLYDYDDRSHAYAQLSHPEGGISIRHEKNRFGIFGTFWLHTQDQGVVSIGDGNGYGTYRSDQKPAAQIARELQRDLLPCYWEAYAIAKATYLQSAAAKQQATENVARLAAIVSAHVSPMMPLRFGVTVGAVTIHEVRCAEHGRTCEISLRSVPIPIAESVLKAIVDAQPRTGEH